MSAPHKPTARGYREGNGIEDYEWEELCPVALGPEILHDLSALYSEV